MDSPTKKLLKKLAKKYSLPLDLIDLNDFGLTKNEKKLLEGFSILVDKALSDDEKKLRKRKNFPKLTKETVLKKQRNRCKKCWGKMDPPHFDHKDGDRSNNHISNCQALCPNCHAKKTRSKNQLVM